MKESFTIKAGMRPNDPREVTVTIGQRYLVSPLNPQKKKHRGRTCVIEEFDDDFAPISAIVRFDNTNRLGKVDLADLVPSDEPKTV